MTARSGATISTALLLDIEKNKASFFSFLMVVPVILGMTMLKLKSYFEATDLTENRISFVALLIGFIAAFLVGLAACKWMIRIVSKGKLIYFAYYCFILSIGCMLFVILS